MRPSTSKPVRSPAQALVREVHLTIVHLAVYLCLFAALGLGVMEAGSSPRLERAVAGLAASPALALRSDWIEASRTPDLRGGN